MDEIIARLEKLAREVLELTPAHPSNAKHSRLSKGYSCLSEAYWHLGHALTRLRDAKEWFNIEEAEGERDAD